MRKTNKNNIINLKSLPESARIELIDYYDHLKKRYSMGAVARSGNSFKAFKVNTNNFIFNREEANAR